MLQREVQGATKVDRGGEPREGAAREGIQPMGCEEVAPW